MKSTSVKHYRGSSAKHMARSMKNDVEGPKRARSAITGRYVTKSSGKNRKN
jgi:hypothetical protein